MRRAMLRALSFAIVAAGLIATTAWAADPLPSWNDGPAKTAIVAFLAKVTKEGSSDLVPPAERIATFDNDGTLWAEQPLYFQLLFALDRVKVLAPQHPEWRDKEPLASLLKGDMKGALAGGEREMLEWTQAGGGARLMMLVHHDDAEREWAYGAESKIGTFSDALMAEAKKQGWVVISMKNDWKRVFAFDK